MRIEGWVIVTGASRGIGRALAAEFAKAGASLVLTARSAGELEGLAKELADKHGTKAAVVPCDLATEDGRALLASGVAALEGRLAGLVNNAGFGTAGLFRDCQREEENRMIRLNCEAVVDLAHRFLPRLEGTPGAFIVNVASTAAFQPVPLFASYAATKAFVLSFSEALAEELEGKVHVLALCPGVTESGFQATANVALPKGSPTSEQVAAYTLEALEAKRRVAVHGFKNAFLAFATRFSPRTLSAKAARRVMEPWFDVRKGA